MTAAIRVSILIKALNEERKIERCLQAAVREAEAAHGEVILADSLSTDRTIAIAARLPVRIVQLLDENDRSCGAATQLGYQFARGEFLCLVDGDMELEPGFIEQAIACLERNPRVAGVGGLLIDTQVVTPADRHRVERFARITRPQPVQHLGGGGVYRRAAIESVGYLANRWLKGCEEADLGLRLRAKGWDLLRLPVPAVRHTGYVESNWQMLYRLWRAGRISAYGRFLRH